MSIVRESIPCTSKNSQVKSEIITLRESVDEINKCLSILLDKLSGVLIHKLSPGDLCDVSKTETPLVPMALEIKSIREEVRMAIETIQSIIDRCEL